MEKKLERLYYGRIYPAAIAVLITVGHVFALEFYTNALICLIASVGLLAVDSLRHFILPFCAYTYQISVRFAPGMPSYSDVNFSGVRGAVTALVLGVLFVSLVAFVVRRKAVLFDGRSIPLLIPSLAFGLALVLNGALGGEWLAKSLIFGAVSVISLIFVPYLFYFGLHGERAEELLSYFVYVTALIAWMLVIQTLELYFSGSVLGELGTPIKENVVYGWGIWTTGGMALAVLMPVLILGAMREKNPVFYAVTALAALACSVLNLSRAALLVAVVATAAALAVGCIFGERKRAFRVVCGFGAAALFVSASVFYKQISALLRDYADRGFSDNGRFDLWRYGVVEFLDAPIFGKGFFALETDTFQAIGFLPQMLHNTLVQIAASMGLFGLAAYGYYRVHTVRVFLGHPSVEKAMLGLSMVALLLGSMLDNFIFYIQPTFYYSVALALAFLLDKNEQKHPDLKKLSASRKKCKKTIDISILL